LELSRGADQVPVRILCGTEDKLLPWPSSEARFREEWLPQADWVVLHGVGRCPQLDNQEFCIKLEAAKTDEERALIGRQAADMPPFRIETDDCRREYEP
jgi:pimeloyl-ACP methyl ester carboxylesterase